MEKWPRAASSGRSARKGEQSDHPRTSIDTCRRYNHTRLIPSYSNFGEMHTQSHAILSPSTASAHRSRGRTIVSVACVQRTDTRTITPKSFFSVTCPSESLSICQMSAAISTMLTRGREWNDVPWECSPTGMNMRPGLASCKSALAPSEVESPRREGRRELVPVRPVQVVPPERRLRHV